MLALALALLSTSASAQVAGRMIPERPIAERTAAGDSFSFDILIRNANAYAVQLSELELVFLDEAGAALITRRLDGNGAAPSIATIGDQIIQPGAESLFFNPFPLPPPDVQAASIRVRAMFSRVEGEGDVPDVVISAPIARHPARQLTFPLTGPVLVWDGHDAMSHHRRWNYALPFLAALGFASNAMRYSYDFVPLDAEGRTRTADTGRNEDYVGFGAPVRATARGRVTAAVSDRPDDGSFDPATAVADPNSLLGNHVVIQHGDGTFSMYAHLRQGSVVVAVGATVQAGERIAAIGSSGSSLFPHLHYQLVDAPTMRGEGVPSDFVDISVRRGSRSAPAVRGHVDSGDIVVAE